MEIYRTLQQIVDGTTYLLDRNSPEDPIAILRGVRHYEYSLTEQEILRALRPRLILTEDLIDSRYCAAEDKFYPGEFYLHTTSLKQKAIDTAPIAEAARRFGIDAYGIDLPQESSDEEMEEHFFEEISRHAQHGGLLYVTVGLWHTVPSSELIRRLARSEIPCSILYPQFFPKAFSATTANTAPPFPPINL